MSRQVCPFHADEDVAGLALPDGAMEYVCPRTTGHAMPGVHTWLHVPEPPEPPGLSGLAAELRLDIELPAAIACRPSEWLEYAVVEKLYADANPLDFGLLVRRYSHTAIAATKYSTSAFLASALGRLSRTGHVLYRSGPATGRWSYNGQISWWAIPPAPAPENSTSWAQLKSTMDYVPGSTEICPQGLCTAQFAERCPH